MQDTEPAAVAEGAEVMELVIARELAGERLDRALTPLVGGLSRARLQQLIKSGAVTVDGRTTRPRYTVLGGERIRIERPAPAIEDHRAEAIALDIRHADDHIIVVNKPAGLTVHPGAGTPNGTMMNALLHAYPELGGLPRAGIVHRLDKDTSGLLVVARTELAHSRLVAALSARDVHREYLAIVRGVPTGGGRVDAPIGRHPRHRIRMAVVGGGREAVTDYRLGERFAHHCALSVQLQTGRTHQIRVHMAHIGFPLIGDPLYAGRTRLVRGLPEELRTLLQAFPRQALHARELAFEHPASQERMTFCAAPPRDLTHLLRALAARDPA